MFVDVNSFLKKLVFSVPFMGLVVLSILRMLFQSNIMFCEINLKELNLCPTLMTFMLLK